MTEPDLALAVWRKSSHSGGAGECVELASARPSVAVRDSKNPAGAKLFMSRTSFTRLMNEVRGS